MLYYYFVSYYFNDELLLNVTADEFINKVEDHIWSDEEINSFCNYELKPDTYNDSYNDTFNNNDKIRNYTFVYKTMKDKYKTPFIVMTCLFGASLIAIAFLTLSLLNARKNKFYTKTHSTEKSSTEINVNNRKP